MKKKKEKERWSRLQRTMGPPQTVEATPCSSAAESPAGKLEAKKKRNRRQHARAAAAATTATATARPPLARRQPPAASRQPPAASRSRPMNR